MPKLLFARPLDDQERATIEKIMAGDNETLKQRTLIVLLSSEERYRVPEIAPMVGLHVDKVRKWVIRFNKQGLSGLQPPRRKPGPRLIQACCFSGEIGTDTFECRPSALIAP